MSQSIIEFVQDFKSHFENYRQNFTLNLTPEEKVYLRSDEEAKVCVENIELILVPIEELKNEHPYLKAIFDSKYFEIDDFLQESSVLENVCLKSSELDLVLYGVADHDEVMNKEVFSTFADNLKDWIKDLIDRHNETAKWIKESFDREKKSTQLSCKCVQCIADYRSALRDVVYLDIKNSIIDCSEEIKDDLESENFEVIAQELQKLQKFIEKTLASVRYRLKRASIKRLNSQVQKIFEQFFGYESEITQGYIEQLKVDLKETLRSEGLRRDLVSDEEFDRFFRQQKNGLWKSYKYIAREFKSLVRSVLALKRKDISAKILQDYLGQFWIHSVARSRNRKIIYHAGPTNSGKTYHAIEALCQAKRGSYLAPLRLLAAELYDTMNEKGVVTTLLTGEEVIEVDGATHYSSTIEMAKLNQDFDCVVIDEIQMICDPQRGWAWTRALVNMQADEIHLCGDPSVLELIEKILELTGDTLEVKYYNRLTELKVMNQTLSLGELEKGDALVVFSRRNALKYKNDLENLGFKVSIVYGRLSPEVRREQARKFDQEETDVIVATDAIAMGMNLPIKRIVFSTFSKFFDNKEYILTNSEIKQIAGRAGRYKRFPVGHVSALSKEEERFEILTEAIGCELDQKTHAMVGPDLDIFQQVNKALEVNSLPILSLVEFLRLFNTMIFEKPFYCVDLKEMIEVAEMVESADRDHKALGPSEIFGFSCAPVNLGLVEHVQYFMYIVNRFVQGMGIECEQIDNNSNNIDYLETSIKCVELFQWLSRHFDDKHFVYNIENLLGNKAEAVEKLNILLGDKILMHCSSCGVLLEPKFKFNICETCFSQRRGGRRRAATRKASEGGPSRGKGKGPRRGKKSSSRGRRTSNSQRSGGSGGQRSAKKKSPGKVFKRSR